MNKLLPVFLALFLPSSCSQPAPKESKKEITDVSGQPITLVADTVGVVNEAEAEIAAEPEAELYQTFHIVTIAEGENYDSLSRLAEGVAQQLKVNVDNLERIYDAQKGIIVPLDSDDELYRGEYYPRRYADNSVSIEMKHAFADSTAEQDGKLLVVAGIFVYKQQADSVVAVTKASYPSAKVVTKQLYIGCMH